MRGGAISDYRMGPIQSIKLTPAYTRGKRRKTYPPYVALTCAASEARKAGDRARARVLNQQAQSLPSRDPEDPNFRRLWYVRYADEWLLGVVGSKADAVEIKQKIATFLRDELHLHLSEEKTLVTHARDEKARFLGYEIHVLHADDKHDRRGQRCINGSVGLRVPWSVKQAQCAKYTARRRKTLVVCQDCHHRIQYGRHDGRSLRERTPGKPRETETLTRGLEGGDWKSVAR